MAVIGTVYLRVADLNRQIAFYEEAVGLRLHRQTDDAAYLGAGGADLLALIHAPGGVPARRTTGLYHFALRVPERADLARVLMHLIETVTPMQGASDHLVSEAIYLADPEGNGIEIYRDRPREVWYQQGEFRMGTVAMDVQGVMSALEGQSEVWTGLPTRTDMGHIHLHVASIPETEAFYRDVLRMDVMVNIHSATFMSYKGYHHHLGANTWAGHTPPPPDALGLDRFVLHLPDAVTLDEIAARAERIPGAIEQRDGQIILRDPSRNRIALAAQMSDAA